MDPTRTAGFLLANAGAMLARAPLPQEPIVLGLALSDLAAIAISGFRDWERMLRELHGALATGD